MASSSLSSSNQTVNLIGAGGGVGAGAGEGGLESGTPTSLGLDHRELELWKVSGTCHAVISEFTVKMRKYLAGVLEKRQKATSSELTRMDFTQLMVFLQEEALVTNAKHTTLVRRCRDFRNQLSHQSAALTLMRMQRGLDNLRLLADVLHIKLETVDIGGVHPPPLPRLPSPPLHAPSILPLPPLPPPPASFVPSLSPPLHIGNVIAHSETKGRHTVKEYIIGVKNGNTSVTSKNIKLTETSTVSAQVPSLEISSHLITPPVAYSSHGVNNPPTMSISTPTPASSSSSLSKPSPPPSPPPPAPPKPPLSRMNENMLDEAWDEIESSTTPDPSSKNINHEYASREAEKLTKRGDVLMTDFRYTEATSLYTRALEVVHAYPLLSKREASLLLKRGYACSKLSEWVLAQQDAEDALDLETTNAEIYILLGDSLLKQGNEDEALAVYERGKECVPRNATLRLRARDSLAAKTSRSMCEGQSGLDLLAGQLLPLTDPAASALFREGAASISDEKIRRLMKSNGFVIKAHSLRDSGKLAQAVVEYEKAISLHNAEAMYSLSQLLAPSAGTVLVDAARSLKLLKMAAAEPPSYTRNGFAFGNLGVAEAENGLGCRYRDGNGVDVNLVVARSWFIKGANHGNSWAQNNLGCFFQGGIGGEVDDMQARHWFESASRLGLPLAKLNLAEMLLKGKGGTCDIPRAKELLQAAADEGVYEALQMLATLDASGATGTPNVKAAIERLRLAAEKGDPVAQTSYASALLALYQRTKQEAETAEETLKSAIEKKHVPAMLVLGDYLRGENRTQECCQVLLIAAKQGSSKAQLFVGQAMLIGEGIRQDISEGRRWLLRAKRQGEELADMLLGKAEKMMKLLSSVEIYETDNNLPTDNMTFNDRVERMHLTETNLSKKFREAVNISRKGERINPVNNGNVRSMPIILAKFVVMKLAEDGLPSAQRYMKGVESMERGASFANKGHHADAVKALVAAYESADLLVADNEFYSQFHPSIKYILDKEPNHPGALLCWIRDPTQKHSTQTSIEVLRRGVKAHPDFIPLQELLGCTLCFAKEWEMALYHFKKVLELDPLNTRGSEIYYLRGVCYMHRRVPPDVASARKDLLMYLKHAPTGARKISEAYYFLAYLCMIKAESQTANTSTSTTSSIEESMESVNDESSSLQLMKKFFARGEAAEKSRLPIFPDVGQFHAKLAVSAVLEEMRDHAENGVRNRTVEDLASTTNLTGTKK